MDDLLDRLFGGGEAEMISAFAPHTNVAESKTAYEITVDLPGMKPEEFNVEVKENELWITGERKQELEDEDLTFHRLERRYGAFRRVIPLMPDANRERLEAEYKEGVLRVRIPKTEAALPKRIPVKH
jgi:HSP20 family protein